MILTNEPDSKIKKYINKCRKELKKCEPEEIAENKGISNTGKYLHSDDTWEKGTPHQLKGIANYRFLLKRFGIENDYEVPQDGNKAKIVYVQKNPFNVESLSFFHWPKEFVDKGIQVDYNKMIENNFIKKVKGLLEVIGKQGLLSANSDISSLFK